MWARGRNMPILKLDIDGAAEFTLPAADYVAGTPAGGGNGNVKLELA